jgi:putative ABC transport system ATP-binding protein
MISVTGIRKVFSPGTVNEVVALKDVTLKIAEGSFVAVVGTNGSGKTTLLNALAGSFICDAGEIFIAGKNVTKLPDFRRTHLIGRVFQNPFLGTASAMTIAENLRMAELRGRRKGFTLGLSRERLQSYQEKVRSLEMGLENRLENSIGVLSGGQRQALTLLMATLQKPKVLLLDEHTAALDPKSAEQIVKLTRAMVCEHRLTTVMVTHSMHQAATLGDRLIMMNRGEIIDDISGGAKERLTVDDLLNKFAEIRKYEKVDEELLSMLQEEYF